VPRDRNFGSGDLDGIRRAPVSVVRFQIVKRLFPEYGLQMAEIARKTDVTTSAVVKRLSQIA